MNEIVFHMIDCLYDLFDEVPVLVCESGMIRVNLSCDRGKS
jgi:hypothetical protein